MVRSTATMIRDYLVSALRERLPNAPFTFSDDPEFVAGLQSPCLEVGELCISDRGDEAIVYVSKITYSHFGCYEEQPAERKEKEVAKEGAEYVAGIVEDPAILWRTFGSTVGEIRRVTSSASPPRSSRFKKKFLWSGPLGMESTEGQKTQQR